MIAFAAPNVIVRRQPVENPHKERIPHGASTDALGLSPAFPFRAQDRAKGQAGGWRKLGPRLSSMDPTLVKAGLRPPPLAAAALTRVGSIDSSRRQDFDGQERASRGPPTHSKKREPRTFPLDKKVPIQGEERRLFSSPRLFCGERCYGAGGENSAPSLLSNPRW